MLVGHMGLAEPKRGGSVRTLRIVGIAVGFMLLVWGTVLVFATFDRQSHSASDTLRPFIITMAPVWAVAVAGAWALLRSPSRQHDGR
jgi:lipopolysaccharide export LptBFGC system permease protein LptF